VAARCSSSGSCGSDPATDPGPGPDGPARAGSRHGPPCSTRSPSDADVRDWRHRPRVRPPATEFTDLTNRPGRRRGRPDRRPSTRTQPAATGRWVAGDHATHHTATRPAAGDGSERPGRVPITVLATVPGTNGPPRPACQTVPGHTRESPGARAGTDRPPGSPNAVTSISRDGNTPLFPPVSAVGAVVTVTASVTILGVV
jgi:hypothetical protein